MTAQEHRTEILAALVTLLGDPNVSNEAALETLRDVAGAIADCIAAAKTTRVERVS